MNEVYDFLKKCGTYYLATVDGDQPRVRPFGTVDIFEEKLYFQTGKAKRFLQKLKARILMRNIFTVFAPPTAEKTSISISMVRTKRGILRDYIHIIRKQRSWHRFCSTIRKRITAGG